MENVPPNRHDTQTVASTILTDGRLVELVYQPRTKRTGLMVGTDRSVEIVETLSDGSMTLVPMSPKNNLIQHEVVVLPETMEEFGTLEELVHAIEAYIARYLDLSPAFFKVASTYILLSWVYDAFNEMPYLRFRGDFGSGKTRALTIIGSLLYKGFFASGASTVSPIFHILHAFRGSLILDEADFRFSDEKAELSKILNNGNVAGFPVLRQTMNARKEFDPKAFQVFGPKIIGARQSFEDTALESRFLTEDMIPGRRSAHVPKSLPNIQKEEARTLRNRLLAYRYLYRNRVRIDHEADEGGRSDRTNQIIAPLLAVAPTDNHKKAIVSFATDLDADVRMDRVASLDAALVEALVALSATNPGALPVSMISSAFAALAGNDIDRPVTARFTGHLLRKRLRLRTVRIAGSFVVPESEREKIAALGKRFGALD